MEIVPNDKSVDQMSATAAEPIKHGQGLLAKVRARKEELLRTLALVQQRARENGESIQQAAALEEALFAVEGMLTGDLDNIVEATAAQLSQWLERSNGLPTIVPPHAVPEHEGVPTDDPSQPAA